MKDLTKQSLNSFLINKYACFNSERFFLDEFDLKAGFVSIVCSSISDVCPIPLCRGIAKSIKKFLGAEAHRFSYIYVGAYAIKTDKI